MILGNAGALYLLALGLGIILLYFLRAQHREYEVSALFLWEGLASDPHTRAARIRRKLEPLLFVQLLILALVSLALARPSLPGTVPHLSGMAIVLDGSASMRTRTESGETRYALARDQALSLLDTYPTTSVALIQLDTLPRVILPLTADHDQARHALVVAQPTWNGNGTTAMLQGLLTSQEEGENFERVVYLSDRPLSTPLPGVEELMIAGGENVAITAFTVREDPALQGVTTFVRAKNATASYVDTILQVSDGYGTVELSILLPPHSEQGYVLPFPGSHGEMFSARIDPRDDFHGDDIRYFTLDRSLTLRVRWVGRRNRYLEAALNAAGRITLVDQEDEGPVDLVLSYGITLPAEATGNVLLVHAGLDGLVTIGEERGMGEIEIAISIAAPGDQLIEGVDPSNFRVRSVPVVTVPEQGTVILRTGDEPLLYRLRDDERDIVLIAPDLMRTNLPLTVDFPLLVRNILASFSVLPSPVTHTWALVGEERSIREYGEAVKLVDPEGKELSLGDAGSFLPQRPGIYTLTTSKGIYQLAVNVDLLESEPPVLSEEPILAEAIHLEAQTLFPLWPLFAGLAILFLFVETLLYRGWRFRREER
ncbi:BatA and WFA domain-containing protein [Candidatus Bipolaricaulota bacterium]|nr:BatA and WFA domain-containing protein [Candidatus Bipolaricaulota bacterium]